LNMTTSSIGVMTGVITCGKREATNMLAEKGFDNEVANIGKKGGKKRREEGIRISLCSTSLRRRGKVFFNGRANQGGAALMVFGLCAVQRIAGRT